MSEEDVAVMYDLLDALMAHLHDLPTEVIGSPWIEWICGVTHRLAAYSPIYTKRINSGMFLDETS